MVLSLVGTSPVFKHVHFNAVMICQLYHNCLFLFSQKYLFFNVFVSVFLQEMIIKYPVCEFSFRYRSPHPDIKVINIWPPKPEYRYNKNYNNINTVKKFLIGCVSNILGLCLFFLYNQCHCVHITWLCYHFLIICK